MRVKHRAGDTDSLYVTAIPPENAAKALAHPLRATIIGMLAEQQRSPLELSRELNEPIGNTTYHCKVLLELGLMRLVDTAQRRGAIEHYYRALWRVRVKLAQVE